MLHTKPYVRSGDARWESSLHPVALKKSIPHAFLSSAYWWVGGGARLPELCCLKPQARPQRTQTTSPRDPCHLQPPRLP